METIAWRGGRVCLLDQTRIPAAVQTLECAAWPDVVDAIATMVVRGAPAIGCTAALGLAQAAREIGGTDLGAFRSAMESAADCFRASRPTAVNLFWAVDRIMGVLAQPHASVPAACAAIEAEAVRMLDEDVAANRALGAHGASLLPEAVTVLTHCNAGALATAGYGTALGVIRAAVEAGKTVRVFADETRPRFQGARLTAFELARDGIDVTVIADGMAAGLMRAGRIDCAVVGADRIAANGDTANKVGTYGVAVLCRHHGIPFYVAAPLSTVDFSLPDGSGICIEERSHEEMTHLDGVPITPQGVPVINPSFDVTPGDLVTAIVTERGVVCPPYRESLRDLAQGDPQ